MADRTATLDMNSNNSQSANAINLSHTSPNSSADSTHVGILTYDKHKEFWVVMIGCTVGAFFEFYDYSLIIYFENEVSHAFFPSNKSEYISVLESFSLYAAAYVARPFGALLFSYISDKKGRRYTLIITLLLTGIPTVLIGCVPAYDTIGYLATIMVFSLRFLQGLGVSGEFINSCLYIYEYCEENFDNYYAFSLTFLWNGGAGSLLCVIMKLIMNAILTKSQEYLFGFRIPCWLGITILISGYYIRMRLPNDVDIIDRNASSSNSSDLMHDPLRTVYCNNENIGRCTFWSQFALMTTVSIMPVLSHLVSYAWMPDYLADLHDRRDNEAFIWLIVALVIALPFAMFVGFLVDNLDINKNNDKSNKRSALLIHCVIIICVPIILVTVYCTQNHLLLGLLQILLPMISLCSVPANLTWLLHHIKDNPLRSTIVSLPYNLGTIVGGFSGDIMTVLIEIDHSKGALLAGGFVSSMSVLSMICILYGSSHPLQIVTNIKDYHEYQPIGDKNENNIDVSDDPGTPNIVL